MRPSNVFPGLGRNHLSAIGDDEQASSSAGPAARFVVWNSATQEVATADRPVDDRHCHLVVEKH